MTNNAAPNLDNEWTILFFFVGDSRLSASMIPQLKAIKDAGFQKNTTVIVRFDPNDKGTPTTMFEVNEKRKGKPRTTHIGDGNDPFVRNLEEDIRNDYSAVMANKRPTRKWLEGLETTKAEDALSDFLEVCRDEHKAKHYMLFLVGHGGIVGNDAFLPDDEPDTAITLKNLGKILKDFSDDVRNGDGAFELLGMHSCSMSAIEVAYELKGTAKYMVAAEGVSFVGTWPYRQILKKVFNTVEKKNKLVETEVMELLHKLQFLCLHNSTDFKFAGFSADLCLCNLSEKKVLDFNEPLRGLTKALKDGLGDERGKELILLAHWESQSYWQETYTDLYDFCRCLRKKCEADIERLGVYITRLKAQESDGNVEQQKLNKKYELLKSIEAACKAVTDELDPPGLDRNERLDSPEHLEKLFDNLVVCSDYFGPSYQYSHGLSVYFPWSRPIEFAGHKDMERYKDYAFTQDLKDEKLGELKDKESKDDSWFSFLEAYFRETKRKSREEEDKGVKKEAAAGVQEAEVVLAGNIIGNVADGNVAEALPGPGKVDPQMGTACVCESIKNYPREFAMSQGARRKDRYQQEPNDQQEPQSND